MNPEIGPTASLDSEARRKLEVEYQAAVGLVAFESQLFWAIMSAFLVAETVLAGLLAQATVSEFSLSRLLAAAIGTLGCLFWLGAILRSAGYSRLRTYQARELERKLGLSLFMRGEEFAKGHAVIVDGETLKHNSFGRRASIKNSGIALALLFTLLFVIVLFREFTLLVQVCQRPA